MDNETPAEAAQRLEVALTRIAQAAAQRPRRPGDAPATDEAAVPAAVAARLDTIIAGLRAALAGNPDPTD